MSVKVIYQYYKPDQGLEDLKATIYSEATGRPVSGKDIKARYRDQKKDPKTTLYALTEDNPISICTSDRLNFTYRTNAYKLSLGSSSMSSRSTRENI